MQGAAAETARGAPAGTPQGGPARPRLDRDSIARTALELADEEGLAALSMRRLASSLGVGTMTLYGYFRSKDELFDGMTEVASTGLPASAGDGPWRAQLTELMRGLKRTLDAHPTGVELRLRRPIVTPAAMRLTEAGMQALLGAGFGPEEATRCFRTLFLFTFACAAFNSPSDPDSVKRMARGLMAALPEAEYPAVRSTVDEAAETLAGDEQFEFGLRSLLDGFEARLERD